MSGPWLCADRLCRSVAKEHASGPVGASERCTRRAVGECARLLRDKNALAEDRSGGRGVVAGAVGVIQRVSHKVNMPRASRSWTSSISSQFIHTCRSAQREGCCDAHSLFQQKRFLVNRFAGTSSTFPWVIHWCCSKNQCGQGHATNTNEEVCVVILSLLRRPNSRAYSECSFDWKHWRYRSTTNGRGSGVAKFAAHEREENVERHTR